MKNKLFSFIAILISLTIFFSVSVLAYVPPYQFSIDVDTQKMPENAVYVDFLLPIDTDDECYVEFNAENGKKYGIDKDSQISNYCGDGYISYTFHIVDAKSEMRPFYVYSLTVPNEEYIKNQKLFDSLSDASYLDVKDGKNFFITVGYKTADEQRMIKISDALESEYYIDLNKMHATFNHFENTYDYEYCCKNYKSAKVAYLDDAGNILFVSDEIDIYKWSLSPIHVDITLSGTDVESKIESGPPWWFIVPFILAIPACMLGVITTLIVMGINKIRKWIFS